MTYNYMAVCETEIVVM